MSFNQPPPPPGYGYGGQPGPYGQPQPYPPQQQPYPPQPNPYAQPQPQQPQPQPNPYAQPQPQSPQPQPQQPYGYGYPPPPPPPAAKGRGRTVGIVIGVVVAVAVIGGGVLALTGGGSSGGDSADDGKKYKLTTPATVAGTFKRDGAGRNDSDLDADDKKDLDKVPGITDPHPVQADYEGGNKAALQFTGVYGTVAQPEQAVDALFLVIAESIKSDDDKAEAIGSPGTVTPEGLDGGAVMKCQVFKTTVDSSGSSTAINIPVCIWGDTSTVGMVLDLDPVAAVTGSTSTDAAALLTAKVRGDTRVAIG